MTEVRRGDTWHLAYSDRGLYMRLATDAAPVTVSSRQAKEILEAMKELLDENRD